MAEGITQIQNKTRPAYRRKGVGVGDAAVAVMKNKQRVCAGSGLLFDLGRAGRRRGELALYSRVRAVAAAVYT